MDDRISGRDAAVVISKFGLGGAALGGALVLLALAAQRGARREAAEATRFRWIDPTIGRCVSEGSAMGG